MKKRGVKFITSIIIASFIISSSNALIGQEKNQAITQEMNLFSRTVSQYKDLYKRYQQCKKGTCTPQEKERLTKELQLLRKKIIIIGATITALLLTIGAGTYFIRRKMKEDVPELPSLKKPLGEPKDITQEIPQENIELKKMLEQQKETFEKNMAELQERSEALKKSQKVSNDEELKKEIARQQAEVAQRIEEAMQRHPEERKTEEAPERRSSKEEQEQNRALRETAAKKRAHQEALTRIRTKLDILNTTLKDNGIQKPPQLTTWEEAVQSKGEELTLQEANQLIDIIKKELTLPSEKFISLLQQHQETFQRTKSPQQKEAIAMQVDIAQKTYEAGLIKDAIEILEKKKK